MEKLVEVVANDFLDEMNGEFWSWESYKKCMMLDKEDIINEIEYALESEKAGFVDCEGMISDNACEVIVDYKVFMKAVAKRINEELNA